MKKLLLVTSLFVFCLGNYSHADLGDIVLMPGMTHKDIAELQQKLDILGYFNHNGYTNYYGVKTTNAVKRFQEDYGLKVDGIAGNQTISYINAKIKQMQLVEEMAEEKDKPSPLSSRAFIDFARKFLGKPYVYGAASGKAFDCSGLTTFIMKNFGVDLERRANQQFKNGIPVAKEDLKPGDLVFFSSSGKTIGHVGIYIGEHKFIHASSSRKKVVINDLRTYTGKYQGARRYLELEYEEELEEENKE